MCLQFVGYKNYSKLIKATDSVNCKQCQQFSTVQFSHGILLYLWSKHLYKHKKEETKLQTNSVPLSQG